MVYILNTAAIACFVISAMAAGMSVFLFFYLNIRNAWMIAAGISVHRSEEPGRKIVNMRK